MKLKLPSAKIIGFLLIGIMLLSTFAFSVIQSTIFGTSQQTKLPESRIVNYRLTPQQQNLILSSGGSIITFFYSPNCLSCLEQKDYLEGLAQRYNWLYLEEISGNYNQSVYILGFYGQKTLENKSNEEVFSALCEVAYQPPIECAMKAR